MEDMGLPIDESEMVVYMPVMGSPDRALRDARKDPLSIACRNIIITLSLLIQLLTIIVDKVLTVARRALLLRLLDMDTVMAWEGTTVASDTLPCMASAKDAVDACSAVIPSNTCRRREREKVRCCEGDGMTREREMERGRERERDETWNTTTHYNTHK